MKKIIILLFCICVAGIVQAQTAIAPSNFSETGAGTSSNPYHINTLENLYWIAASDDVVISMTLTNRLNSFYEQTANIDASATSTWFPDNSGGYYGWPMLGDEFYDFTGSYNGKGYSISGVYINRINSSFVGFFASISGTVQNLGLTGVSITGGAGVGGLTGYLWYGGSMINCYTTGSVTSNTLSAGGLIGINDGNNSETTETTLSQCHSSCTVSGKTNIGGLIGNSTAGTVSSCYATGATYGATYVGGLVGENNSSVSDCYSKGTVSSNSDGGYYGGLIGHNTGSVSKCYSISPIVNGAAHAGFIGDNSGTVSSNCFWNSSINPVGYDNNSSTFSALGKTTAQMQTASLFTGAGWSASVWSLVDNIYPALVAFLKAPTITTQPVSSISSTTATGNGTISDLGYPATMAAYGVCWNTLGTPIITDNKNDNGTTSTTGAFTAGLTGLVPNTTYFARAFAKNNATVTYGTQVTFTTTAIAPTVSSVSATGITGTGALLNGSVNANNTSTTATFDYGTTNSPYLHTDIASTPGTVTGTSVTPISLAVTGLIPNTTYHYRVKGVNTAGTTNGTDLTFSTLAVVSTANTTPATGITTTGATLNGSINANNASTVVSFEYGLTTSYGTNVTATQSPVSGTTATTVTYSLTGLVPNTTYHYRVKGVNTAGTANGTDLTFTTLAAGTTTTTTPATGISTTGATLNGSINANNASTVVSFEYGTTTSYGTNVTAMQSPVTGTTATMVSYALSGLIPNTTYHYRVKGVNTAGTTNGIDLTFTTLAVVPTVTTSSATLITTTGATLNGSINANNASTVVSFEYGLTTNYGTSVTAMQSPLSGTTATAVSYGLTGLVPNTTYHYRVVCVNVAGTVIGQDQSFSTAIASGLNETKVDALSIYPNPASEGFYIQAGENTTRVYITDLSGGLVLTQQVTEKSYINISKLPKGVYIVKANGLVGKLVKK
jgi:phosphodiesterase/alkaline phosphatase D-like protein